MTFDHVFNENTSNEYMYKNALNQIITKFLDVFN